MEVYKITAEQAIIRSIWEDICEMRGWNVWIVKEGRMDADEVLEFTPDEARRLGLLDREEDCDYGEDEAALV